MLLATAAVCLSQAAVASARGGGNSANAKLCQKGGWQTLVRSDGSSFASQDACVSYAAQGGTLVRHSSQTDCQSLGGTFATGPGIPLWTCDGIPNSADVAAQLTLEPDCTNDGGGGYAIFFFSDHINFQCE